MRFNPRSQLRPEHRFIKKVILPRHPDQPKESQFGDPRKKWLYDCASGQFAAEDDSMMLHRTYRFTDENDQLMFVLMWGGIVKND